VIDFFIEAFRPVNLPFTALLGMVTFYWILVGLGALDFHTEPAVEVGHDAHLDVHADAAHGDVSHDAGSGLQGALKGVLQFLNFGNVPTMIVASVMTLSLWTCSMLGNYYFNEGSYLRALVLLVPNLLLTAVITKLATTPLKKLFNALNREYDEHKPVVGRTCTILTSEVTDKFGQAQIETSGAPIIIHVRTFGDATFTKGESALIVKEDNENNIFTVAKLSSTTQQQEESHVC
jgi:hypothetical protein